MSSLIFEAIKKFLVGSKFVSCSSYLLASALVAHEDGGDALAHFLGILVVLVGRIVVSALLLCRLADKVLPYLSVLQERNKTRSQFPIQICF